MTNPLRRGFFRDEHAVNLAILFELLLQSAKRNKDGFDALLFRAQRELPEPARRQHLSRRQSHCAAPVLLSSMQRFCRNIRRRFQPQQERISGLNSCLRSQGLADQRFALRHLKRCAGWLIVKPPESFIDAVDLNLRSASPAFLMGDDSLGDDQRAQSLELFREIRLTLNSAGKVFGEKMRSRKDKAGTTQAAKKQFPKAAANRITHQQRTG